MKTELYNNVMGEPEVLSIVLEKRKEYFEALGKKYAGVKRIYVLGSGTSYHAGLSVRRQMEKLTGVEVVAAYPSVFMETQVLPEKDTLCIGISQSGRSSITAKGVQRCRELGHYTVAISANNPSTLTESAEDYIPLVVGIERSASTKGYVTSMKENYNKASLVFSVRHIHGSLSKVLTIMSFYVINLTKIQSMPIIGREWEYSFFVDVTFDDYIIYRQALEAVRPFSNDFQVLGEYVENIELN